MSDQEAVLVDSQGRITNEDGSRLFGVGFGLGHDVVITAAHVVRDDWRASGFRYQTRAGRLVPVVDVRRDDRLDVALLTLAEPVAAVPGLATVQRGQQWTVTAQPTDADAVLTGTVTAPRHRIVTSHSREAAEVMQLLVNELPGNYHGYSGAAVWVGSSVVGVLVEQVPYRSRDRADRRAANVLYAAPIDAVVSRLGLNVPIRPVTVDDDVTAPPHPVPGNPTIAKGPAASQVVAGPRSPRRRRRALVAAALAVCVPMAAVTAYELSGPHVTDWDDTLYPQEIPSIRHDMLRQELVDWMIGPPKVVWTAEIWAPSRVVGGDSTIVLLQSTSYVVGLDMVTGAPRWPVIDTHEYVQSCAVRENRIGCVATSSDGSDSTVFILDADTGQIVKTTKVPNQELHSIVVSGDRFVASSLRPDYDGDRGGFAAGYTTEGDQVWTREGYGNLYVVARQGILVDTASDADEVVFVRTDDGREVLRSTRASSKRALAWSVFRGGIAIQNPDFTGTDIYDLKGNKKASIAGWEPIGFQSHLTPTSLVPLLTRLGTRPPHYPDRSTIAAANPDTGHLLWRIHTPGLSGMATVSDLLIVEVIDPDAPRDSVGIPVLPYHNLVRVYDCITGEPLSPLIDMGNVQADLIESDGYTLTYVDIDFRRDLTYAPHIVSGYDISSGSKSWELTLKGPAEYVGGRLVAVSEAEQTYPVSLLD